MVSKILHISCMVLLGILAILLCVNSISALSSDYEKTEFTVVDIYQDYREGDKKTVYLQGVYNNELFNPENVWITDKNVAPGDKLEFWYSPSANLIDSGHMNRIIMNFVSAALAIGCIIFTFPRPEKMKKMQAPKSKK